MLREGTIDQGTPTAPGTPSDLPQEGMREKRFRNAKTTIISPAKQPRRGAISPQSDGRPMSNLKRARTEKAS